MDERDFGEDYFLHDCGRPYQRDQHFLPFFGRIADAIVSGIRPRRVLDAGCAMGLLVEALRERGVDAYGFDISSYALARVANALRPYCWQASLTDEIAERYDLIVCQEVLPHLPLADAEHAVGNLCRHADDVLFSVMPYPPAPRHANIEPPEHWARVFARHGFYRDFDFDASVVTPWAIRYRRSLQPMETLVYQYERRMLALRSERDDARAARRQAEERMANLERGARQTVAAAWRRAARMIRRALTWRDSGPSS